jgi:hypothetical protein
MGLKDLIFKSDDDDKKVQHQVKREAAPAVESDEDSGSVKFPSNEPLFNSEATTSSVFPETSIQEDDVPLSCQPHIDKVIQMYEDGFASLDQDGFDFYEFFQTILKGGIHNPAAYTMAFQIASTMTTISKAKLIEQSNFYLTEINKVYMNYVDSGNSKELQLKNSKNSEESNLRLEVSNLDKEIKRLQLLKDQKQAKLNSIDSRYQEEVDDLHCKTQANQIAKDKLVGKINTVVQGIKTNIQ